jgi:S1-C subfamily serine protease
MSKWKPKPGAKPLIAKKWASNGGSAPEAPPRNQEAPVRPALAASNSGRAPCAGCKGTQLRVAVGQKEATRQALVSAIEKVAGFVLSFFDAVVLEAEPVAAPSASSGDRWEGLGFGVVATNDGIVVSHVSGGNSPGAVAGLAPGDMIFQVEDEHPKDIASFADAIRKGEKWAVHRLMFLRDGQPQTVAIANPKA